PASFFATSNGTIQMATPFPDPIQDFPGNNPPLVEITRLSLPGGRLFTNQVDGAPFAIGRTVRTVGTVNILNAINGDNFPVTLPNGTFMSVIFAVEGKIIDPTTIGLPAGTPIAKFDVGRLFLVSRTTGNPSGFLLNDPTTWNFGNQFAEFSLLPQ